MKSTGNNSGIVYNTNAHCMPGSDPAKVKACVLGQSLMG